MLGPSRELRTVVDETPSPSAAGPRRVRLPPSRPRRVATGSRRAETSASWECHRMTAASEDSMPQGVRLGLRRLARSSQCLLVRFLRLPRRVLQTSNEAGSLLRRRRGGLGLSRARGGFWSPFRGVRPLDSTERGRDQPTALRSLRTSSSISGCETLQALSFDCFGLGSRATCLDGDLHSTFHRIFEGHLDSEQADARKSLRLC